MAAGRDEEARAFLTRFHGSGNPDDPVVELEWAGEFLNSLPLELSV